MRCDIRARGDEKNQTRSGYVIVRVVEKYEAGDNIGGIRLYLCLVLYILAYICMAPRGSRCEAICIG